MSTILGIDVGGTFTDVVLRDDAGQLLVEKVPSTPDDPSRGVLDGILALQQRRNVDPSSIDLFAHGSTVATNALLEFKLPRTVLLVTAGFRDVLEIGTQLRPSLFNLQTPKQAPIVPRADVIEVAERLDRDGNVVEELTDDEIGRVVDEVRARDVRACAVSLLFSFNNGDHEQRLADALAEAMPDLSVATSARVAPEIKEYPRASTTCVAAALQPLVSRYITGVDGGIREAGLTCPFFIMQSNGGVMSADDASRNAHRMVLSGPAAGALAASREAGRGGLQNQITFDMGGTSTDICLIHEGRARVERETVFDGRPLRVPQFDIHTIGSGGGSIATIDDAGLLKVGPQSAGAVPGPACYGRGGTQPTVTDAQVVLQRVDPDRFLAGQMVLDARAARQAVKTHVADPLDLTVEEAALGILDVAEAQMARGVRVVSVNRGFDPRDFTLVAYGGAGPMHGLGVGELVEVAAVVIPVEPGTYSALGLACSDLKYDFSRSVERPMGSMTAGDLEEVFAPMIATARQRLGEVGGDGLGVTLQRILRMRYSWQDSDVEVVAGPEPITDDRLDDIVADFHDKHEFEFGYRDEDEQVEVVALDLEAYGAFADSQPVAPPAEPAAAVTPPRPDTERKVWFRDRGWMPTPIHARANLRPGMAFDGPAIIEEREATTIVGPNGHVTVDGDANLVLTHDKDAQ